MLSIDTSRKKVSRLPCFVPDYVCVLLLFFFVVLCCFVFQLALTNYLQMFAVFSPVQIHVLACTIMHRRTVPRHVGSVEVKILLTVLIEC